MKLFHFVLLLNSYKVSLSQNYKLSNFNNKWFHYLFKAFHASAVSVKCLFLPHENIVETFAKQIKEWHLRSSVAGLKSCNSTTE